jgi:hypothetical protein
VLVFDDDGLTAQYGEEEVDIASVGEMLAIRNTGEVGDLEVRSVLVLKNQVTLEE